MSSHERRVPDPRALCAQLFPDDGVDPREDARHAARINQKPDRKLRQLCKQVARALQLALAELPQADDLAGVSVREVTPAPDANRLCALLVAPDPARFGAVEQIVQRFAGRLRAEVAAAITRRRAPELTFALCCTTDGAGFAGAPAPSDDLRQPDTAPPGGDDQLTDIADSADAAEQADESEQPGEHTANDRRERGDPEWRTRRHMQGRRRWDGGAHE